MAKKKVRKAASKTAVKKVHNAVQIPAKKKMTMGLAIVSLILNILIIPGLGTLVAGRMRSGVWQLLLAVVGFILSFVLIGIPILIAAWIWGLVSGVRFIQEAESH
ncbi:MAG: hypothetical protein KKD18_03080 [Nanoarchaeota archaeon]|nr:hypothetical protein [Nanoarchaeota archaeon]